MKNERRVFAFEVFQFQFSQTRQFDDLIRKNIHYHEYREVNKRKGQTVRSMKPLLVDGTARVLQFKCYNNLLRYNMIQNDQIMYM